MNGAATSPGIGTAILVGAITITTRIGIAIGIPKTVNMIAGGVAATANHEGAGDGANANDRCSSIVAHHPQQPMDLVAVAPRSPANRTTLLGPGRAPDYFEERTCRPTLPTASERSPGVAGSSVHSPRWS